MKLSKTKKAKLLRDLNEKHYLKLIGEAVKLEPSVPGITRAIREDLKSIQNDLTEDIPVYLFSIQAQLDSIVSHLKWAKQGLYKEVRGTTWIYA